VSVLMRNGVELAISGVLTCSARASFGGHEKHSGSHTRLGFVAVGRCLAKG
jgi:hypothetical protein